MARTSRIDPGIPRPLGETRDRLPELDALRGLAALAIVIVHARPRWLGSGWVAVDFFFVLSGYLITTIVLRHGGANGFLRAFYVRRSLRVWPIYLVALALVLLLNPWLGGGEVQWGGLPTHLTFTQNVSLHWSSSAPYLTRNFLHTWTLAIEEQFYLIWPLTLVLIGRTRARVGTAAAALVVLSVVARGQGLPITVLLARCDGLAMGGLLAAVLDGREARELPTRRLRTGFAVTAVVSVGALSMIRKLGGPALEIGVPSWPGLTLLGFNLLFFSVIGLVVCHSGGRWLAPLRYGPLVRLGDYSYGLYLYHFILMGWSDAPRRLLGVGGPGFWRLITAGPLALLTAWLSWKYLERPVLSLKDRFPYRHDSVATTRLGTSEPGQVPTPHPLAGTSSPAAPRA
ncbi:MAG: acyltransferase family protein [Isosphaeraceae bacterium]